MNIRYHVDEVIASTSYYLKERLNSFRDDGYTVISVILVDPRSSVYQIVMSYEPE